MRLADTDDTPLAPDGALRVLKWLVLALTATMLVGIVVITVLLVGRLRSAPPPALPATVVLPDGTVPLAFTQGPDWLAVATPDEILIYTPDGRTLRQRIEIARD